MSENHFIGNQTLPLFGIKEFSTYSVIKGSIIVLQKKKISTYTLTHRGSLATLYKFYKQ